jgi:hypothetical protein
VVLMQGEGGINLVEGRNFSFSCLYKVGSSREETITMPHVRKGGGCLPLKTT